MVKIPKLAKDGQNWKIYHAKFLEVAATFDCLEVLAGRPYEGEDWDGCNALLCCTFMESVPPSIYFKIRHRTAHENFKYLVKRFRDSEPIPCANELQCAGTAAAVETPENYPTSDEEDLSNSKALTRGTEDVDNRNVGHQDPRTSFEASAQGTSAKCIEMTPVVLESTLHESQDQLQDSLQATPYACEQEAVDSIVTAGRTNGTAKMAKPNVTDVDGKAALGRDLVERRSGIAKEDIPFANGLPLEGEWTVNPSGERDMSMRASVGGTDSNAGRKVEPVDTPNELEQLMTMSIEPDDADGGGILIERSGCFELPNGWVKWPCEWVKGPDVVSHGDEVSSYLGVRDAKRLVLETDGARNHADTLATRTEPHSVETHVILPANEMQNVRMHRIRWKLQDSSYTLENETPEPIRRWRKVSVEDTDAEDADQVIAPNLERAGEAIAPNVGETARNGDGDGDSDDGDVDGATSSGDINSNQVEEVLLAVESQYMCQGRRTRNSDLPMLSEPPIQPTERPYGLVRCCHRCGRIKPEPINVSQTPKVKKTYHGRANAAQPPENSLKCPHRVIGLVRRRWRRGWIEIASVKLEIERVSAKIVQEGETAYLGRAHTAQPPGYHSKRRQEVHGPWCRHGRIKIEPVKVKIEHLNVSQVPEVETTYRIRVSTAQPRGTPSKCFHWVIGPWR
ncbi:hypothetical protein SCLCIDRAFT_30049 [Scleroderma citrinum Foug A]|uniref:Uncharacterized protein n=1 Tax=Scleroderma citrinum Foug A TaxID=1036808 RepID=A0A0C2ZTA7_9AGAM|nr:hypothetical protein SCLCIDRAFT_30049 [Scleroderma citrinum Foug A]